jgi:AcrR family transcriptional regulator
LTSRSKEALSSGANALHQITRTQNDPAEHRGNRYGRSNLARQAVLEAADGLLVECGFAKFTIEGIAARAGVAKQTIYRWWPSKTDVLMDAFLEDVIECLNPPDQGSLDTDLRLHLMNCAEFLSASDAGAVFRALLGEAQHDAKLAARLQAEFIVPQRARDSLPFERAIARGQLPPTTDVGVTVEELMAPLYYRILVTGQPATPKYAAELANRLSARLATGAS